MTSNQLNELCAKRMGCKLSADRLNVIKSVCAGVDSIIVSYPDLGRNAMMFAAALANEDKPTLVIEPTVSLMDEAIRDLSLLDVDIKAACLSEFNREHHEKLLKKYRKRQIDLLCVTSNMLKKKYFRKAIEETEPWLVIVNECHLVMDWTGRFGSDYLNIAEVVNGLHNRPTIFAMTATLPPDDFTDICERLDMDDQVCVAVFSVYNPNLSIIVEDCSNHASENKKTHTRYILNRIQQSIIEYVEGGSVIIYTLTPNDVEFIADSLKTCFRGEVVVSHDNLPNWKRDENERLFMTNMSHIMVTTNGVGQAIDKNNIDLVIHVGLPLSVTDYYQQIGRAFKDGCTAHAVVFYDKELMKKNEKLINSAPKAIQKQLKKRQKELETIITGNKCITQGLLKALGEKRKPCRHCSACRQKKEK